MCRGRQWSGCSCSNFLSRTSTAARLSMRFHESPVQQSRLILAEGWATATQPATRSALPRLQGGLVGVFGIHSWELEDPASWQDPDAAAVPPPLSDSQEKNGLAPRQIIAATPGRRNWAVSGAVTAGMQECSGRLTRGAAGSGPGVAGSRSSSSRSSSAPACQAGQAANEQQEELPAGLAQLRLPVSEPENKPSTLLPALALPAAAEPPVQAPAADKAGQGSSALSTQPHGGSNSAAVRQFLSPESAGARLGALAAGAASSKAASWALPFVQVHSALELQRMGAVPPDTGKAGRAQEWARSTRAEGAGAAGRCVRMYAAS